MIRFFSFLVLIFIGGFTATALAAGAAVPADGSLLDLLKPVVEAFTHGRYLYAGMLALLFAVAAFKRWAPQWKGTREFVQSDAGGALTTLVMSFAGAMVSTLGAEGNVMTWPAAKAALLIAITAAGGYSMIRRLIIVPILIPLAKKCPAWSQPIFSMLMWVFDKPTPIEQAQAAGAAAVAANPAPGMAGTDGVKDVE